MRARRMLTLARGAVLALSVIAAHADTVNTRALTTSQLAPGVYTIRHPDPTDDFPDGNTTVIVGERSVLVIDTGYLPSTARADIERIRGWTGKPVRYVLNTHWHNDHNGGNHVYLQAFPGADVIAHHETKAMMDARIRSYVTRFVAEDSVFAKQRADYRRSADTGLDEKGSALTSAQREVAAHSLRLAQRAVAEFRSYVYQSPTLTFDSKITLDLGGREVELMFLGRGNTGGDVVAYLPKERILVAGDLIDHPVPYAFGGYPSEWLKTLRRIEALDIDTIVPGHGEVLRGKAYVQRLMTMLPKFDSWSK